MPKLMSGNSSTRRVDGCRNNKPNQQSRKALLISDTANMWVTVVELIDMQKGDSLLGLRSDRRNRTHRKAKQDQSNGLVEKCGSTLKTMMKRLASDRQKKKKNWDRYINSALFAYRESPQESLRFSALELLFARQIGG